MLLQWKSTSVYTSWTYSTYHLRLALGHLYASYCKFLSDLPCILGKNISKFVFEHSRFRIAETFQSLFCDVHSAATVTQSHTCWAKIVWYGLYFFEINGKCATGNSVMFMLLHWYCYRGFGCGKMITFALKIFNIFCDVYTRDGTISLGQHDASAQVMMSHNQSTLVWDPFWSPPPLSSHDMIITDICQYIMCPI